MGSPALPVWAPLPTAGCSGSLGCSGLSSPRSLTRAPLWAPPPVSGCAFRSPGSGPSSALTTCASAAWDLGCCALLTSYRAQVPVPGTLPEPHTPPLASSSLPQAPGWLPGPRQPRCWALPATLHAQRRLWPRPGPREGLQGRERRGHSRVVDDLQPLPFLEGQVGLCPGLIVIEGHKGGHSTCGGRGVSERQRPLWGDGWTKRPCALGGWGLVSHRTSQPSPEAQSQSQQWPLCMCDAPMCPSAPVRACGRHVQLLTPDCPPGLWVMLASRSPVCLPRTT